MPERTPICILHTGDAADGDLAQIFARLLQQRIPGLQVGATACPFHAEELTPEALRRLFQQFDPPANAVVIGIRVGGLAAAKLQEQRPDLVVFAVHAPTSANGVVLQGRQPRRFALYRDSALDGADASWTNFAEDAYCDRWVSNRATLASVIAACLKGEELGAAVRRITSRLQGGIRPEGPLSTVYLLHGKGGSPEGSVSRLEEVLSLHWHGLDYHRPLLPHHDEAIPPERSVEYLQTLGIPEGALLVGVSLGGLVAAKYQEERPDLKVFAINSPTWHGGVRVERPMEQRVAVYSSNDEVIAGRTADWPHLAEAYDFPWLTHETTPHVKYLIRLIDWYLEGRLALTADRVLFVQRTQPEREEAFWRSLSTMPVANDSTDLPLNFDEIARRLAAGGAFAGIWQAFLRGVYAKHDLSCFAHEPPRSLPAVDRAWLAGVTEFLCHKLAFAVPEWTSKAEYVLPCLTAHRQRPTHDEDSVLFLRQARTPKELLRHNVIAEAKTLIPE